MKLLFLTNVPSPYRVDFFNELGKHCDLTVLFEKATSSERNKIWKEYSFKNFNGVILNGISCGVDSALTFKTLKYLKDKSFDAIVCCGISSPTAVLSILYMKLRHIAYYLEADGGMSGSGKGIKEKLKKLLITGAKGYFSTSKLCDKYFSSYGADQEKIHRYPFTSLYEADILKQPVSSEDKTEIRAKLGIKEDYIIVSVGRFSYDKGYGKGYDTLLKAAEKLPKDIGIYIIGDEPTKEFANWKLDKDLSQVHFLPFKKKEELFEYYKAADITAFLSRGEAWGLVINESLANGCPVITTDRVVAGFELINEDVNGYIIKPDDVDTLCTHVRILLDNKEKLLKMGLNSIEAVKDYTIENMAKVHMQVFEEV